MVRGKEKGKEFYKKKEHMDRKLRGFPERISRERRRVRILYNVKTHGIARML